MTFSYSGDPATSDKDAVRFFVGDTDATDPLTQDEEIDFLLVQQGSPLQAAAFTAESIAGKFSRIADTKVGPLSESGSQIAKAFLAKAKQLRAQIITENVEPFFGGLTISGKRTLKQDTDAVQPSFEIGQDDFPGIKKDQNFFDRFFGF